MKKSHEADDSESFFRRMSYVVLDEIHCIGSTGSIEDADGAVLERLLCMIECPIICLSATLANSTEFVGWLNEIRSSTTNSSLLKGDTPSGQPAVEEVHHNERSTALHYHSLFFTPQKARQVKRVHKDGGHVCEVDRIHQLIYQGGSTVMSGMWILRLPNSPNLREIFEDEVCKQSMRIDLQFNFGDGEAAVESLLRRQSSDVSDVNVSLRHVWHVK